VSQLTTENKETMAQISTLSMESKETKDKIKDVKDQISGFLYFIGGAVGLSTFGASVVSILTYLDTKEASKQKILKEKELLEIKEKETMSMKEKLEADIKKKR
jgi:hypothetical protein